MKVRSAKRDDLSRIAEIFVFNNRINYYPIFKDENYSFHELQVESLVNEHLIKELDNHDLYVYDDGIVRGFILIQKREICKLYVDPFFQNQGIGDQLMNYALEKFEVNCVWILEKNIKAKAFYERYGFKANGNKELEEGTIEYQIQLEK